MSLPKVSRPFPLTILADNPAHKRGYIAANHQGARHQFVFTTARLTKRVTHTKETERLVADPAPGITAAPHEDNLRYFDVTIQGPDGSPFQRE
jgi:hypothetical protein